MYLYMQSYYNKFIKYKSKYLKLLNEHNMKGGEQKVGEQSVILYEESADQSVISYKPSA